MIEGNKKTFDNWTDYDNWLIANYAENSVFSVNEVNGKIEIEYCDKPVFQEEMKRLELEKEKAAKEEKQIPEKNEAGA